MSPYLSDICPKQWDFQSQTPLRLWNERSVGEADSVVHVTAVQLALVHVTATQIALTVPWAIASATGSLLLRCQGKARPFGPGGWWLAIVIILLTGLVSSAVALVGGELLNNYLSTVLGAVAPGGLWLSQVRSREDDRRSPAKEAATVWV